MLDYDQRARGAEEPHPPSRHLPPAQPVHAGRAVRGLLRDRAGDEPQLRPGGDRDLRRDGAGQPRRPRRAADQDAERVRRRVRQPGRHGVVRRGARARDVRVGAARHGQARAGSRRSCTARARRCASRASTRCSTSPTSAGSPASRARPRRRWWRASCGSSTTTTSTRRRSAGGRLFVTVFAGLTMVSNLKYWSFKTINLRKSVPFVAVLRGRRVLALLRWQPPLVLFARLRRLRDLRLRRVGVAAAAPRPRRGRALSRAARGAPARSRCSFPATTRR